MADNIKNPFDQKAFYYPSLDGLRFFGFLGVFLHHNYQTYFTTNLFGNFYTTIFRTNGWVGMDLFLILSGFLVTILLLKERASHNKINIKDFQIRRALRIWPLYYLALLLGFIAIPFFLGQFNNPKFVQQLWVEFPWYALFLGNWSVIFGDYSFSRYVSILWTISLEQQFYFIWPFILLTIHKFKSGLFWCIFLIISAISLRWVLIYLFNAQHPDIYVNTFARMDTLVYGALIAFATFYVPNYIKYLKPFLNLPLQIFIFISFLIFLFIAGNINSYAIRHSVWGYILVFLVLGYFIISAMNLNSLFAKFLEIKALVWLGKLSYGLYVWHLLGIDLSRYLVRGTIFSFIEPFLALGITIVISWISYKFFETKFLKLKSKFTKIVSRPV